MNRTQALEHWRRVAAGDLERDQYDGIDLHAWIKQVAADVLAADDEPLPSKRRAALTKAISMDGRSDGYAALRRLINEPHWEFRAISPETGESIEVSQARLVERIEQEARRRGLLRGIYAEDRKKALDRIRELAREKFAFINPR